MNLVRNFRKNRFHSFSQPSRKVAESLDVVNFVLLGSLSGRYGGPFETSKKQVELTRNRNSILLTSFFLSDAPSIEGVPYAFARVKHLFGLKNFFDVGSLDFFKLCWQYSKCKIAHISFARGISTYLFSIFCILHKSKLIIQTHGMLTSRIDFPQRVLDRFVTRAIMSKASAVIALTEIEKNELLVLFPACLGKITVLGNPIQNFGFEASQSTNNGEALFAARLHSRKKVLDFGKAAVIAKAENLRGNFKALGPDEGELDDLQKITRGLSNFRYLGSTDAKGVIEELVNSSVFVLPSFEEPWGNVLVSAITLGKPVVVTKSSHLAKLIQEFEAGLVVEDSNPRQIAEAVHFLLDENNYETYSKNAWKLGQKKFSESFFQSQLNSLYGEVQ